MLLSNFEKLRRDPLAIPEFIRFNLSRIVTQVIYSKFFRKIGKKTCIIKPLKISGARFISIGHGSQIAHLAWLLCEQIDQNAPDLSIGCGCQIGHFAHLTCVRKVVIGNQVMIADKVYISDNTHSYQDPNVPILSQPVMYIGDVKIGDNVWIGENVSILGVEIGRNSVIAANSVVNKNIPPFSVAAGCPAKVVKHFDFEKGVWVRN